MNPPPAFIAIFVRRRQMKLFENNTPRWIIFSIDVFIAFFSLSLAFLLRFNFEIPEVEIETFPIVFPYVIGVRLISFVIARTYSGIIRYTSTKDAQRIFTTISAGSLFLAITNIVSAQVWEGRYLIPFSVIVIDYLATTFVMIASRIFVKILFFEIRNISKERSNFLIFGAGEAGIITKQALDRESDGSRVFGFIDDNKKKAGKRLEGVSIHHGAKLQQILDKNDIDALIVAAQNVQSDRLNELAEQCLKHGVRILNVPPVSRWINGELSFKQIKSVKIEDLLGRNEIQLSEKAIKKNTSGKRVLVTGAAGSIGSEIVRQLTRFKPEMIILLDQAESPLYDLEFELTQSGAGNVCEVVVGDIRSKERMRNLFQTFKPEIVYHAAAYKHVPLMENNPSEAVRTNIEGTRNLVDLSMEEGVDRFVMVSTDKAVNPTNVMGASKRIAEILAQASNNSEKTKFITTRFGNVLGSNGSVIPLFKRQIEKGGPITVTDPEITRYFMTIPEACQLVLEAGTMGQGGEIFIFDMGSSVKIVDLAKKMVSLSGLELGKDIQIVYTGLRPGEKLYEELLADKENTMPTHHPQIMIAKVRTYNLEEVTPKINELIGLFGQQNNNAIVERMKDLVPEFISNNSEFEQLDVDRNAS